MKTATLIAVIAIVIQTLASLYWLLITFDTIHYDVSINKITQPLLFLSCVGLMIFFIQLYQKQTKN